jgi:hypothetical protein
MDGRVPPTNGSLPKRIIACYISLPSPPEGDDMGHDPLGDALLILACLWLGMLVWWVWRKGRSAPEARSQTRQRT